MSLPLLLVLMYLASYRLWRLLALDDLPPLVAVRDRIEGWIDHRHGPDWSSGLKCAWCLGFWCSVAVVGATWAVVPLPLPVLWFAAVSTAVGVTAMIVED